MRRAWQVATSLAGVLGVFMAVQSLNFPLYDATGPRAGFFPFWLSVFLVATSFGMLLKVSFSRAADASEVSMIPQGTAAARVLLILGGMLAVILLMETLGFRLTLLLFLLFAPAVLGARSWFITSVVAVVGSFGVFHLFTYWLQVQLPVGLLGI